MRQTIDDMEWKVRSSQVIRTFAPGSIYDNTEDSVMIQGIDYWNDKMFGSVSDPYLLSEVRAKYRYLSNLKKFVSVSNPLEEARIPVFTFPTWGVCPSCGMLQRRHGQERSNKFRCKSRECVQQTKGNKTSSPHTVPVRFVVACERGHVDDFPFYEWVHGRGGESSNCPRSAAHLYLEDRDTGSSSLDSKFVRCLTCNKEKNLAMALTRSGIREITGRGCTGRSPWLRGDSHVTCNLTAMGMLKGATNIYFPVTRSALTIPPFSDELSQSIIQQWHDVEKLTSKPAIFEEAICALFDNDGEYTPKQVLDKYVALREARSKTVNILELEYSQLNSGIAIDEKEFKTSPLPVPTQFHNSLGCITLVEKLRQIITVTGFTRLIPPEVTNADVHIAPISSSRPEWLPAAENRGEGIFLSLDYSSLEKWESTSEVRDRLSNIVGCHDATTVSGTAASSRYILLHTLSHLIIHSMAGMAGYSSASLQERVYSSDSMAGVLVYTSSPSSDGSLGGLAELGKSIEQIILRAIHKATTCSSDPLCAFEDPNKNSTCHGAACHACAFVPETSCESMNEFLDRSMVCRTLDGRNRGFFPNDDL